MKILILSSDKTINALPGTLYLLDKFWPGHPPVVIGGYTPPAFDLRDAEFYSIGKFEDYPVEKWSDGVIEFLQAKSDQLCVLWMDDYWLIRDVDAKGVELLERYMMAHRQLARCDLTLDRWGAEGVKIILGTVGHLNIITNILPAPYTMSFQAGIWRKEELLKYLVPDETGWQAELSGTGRMIEGNAKVVGTKQGPVKYLIAVQQGKVTLDGGYQGGDYALSNELREEMQSFVNIL